MCYDIDTIVYRAVKEAKSKGFSTGAIDEMVRELLEQWYGPEHFHASGFDHPEVACIVRGDHMEIQKMKWGLVPSWVKSKEEAAKIRNQTLIARSETVFEKASFKEAVRYRRCLLPLGGFYEHQHKFKKTFPYHIDRRDGDVLILAAIWESGLSPDQDGFEKSFAILTTEGNEMMTEIHNNPNATGPRMPLVLDAQGQRIWLDAHSTEDEIKQLFKPAPNDLLKAHTVRPLKGARATGDNPQAVVYYHYPELDEPLTLF